MSKVTYFEPGLQEFVEKYYPNYSGCSLIAELNDISRDIERGAQLSDRVKLLEMEIDVLKLTFENLPITQMEDCVEALRYLVDLNSVSKETERSYTRSKNAAWKRGKLALKELKAYPTQDEGHA
jgi:hypothetical protein